METKYLSDLCDGTFFSDFAMHFDPDSIMRGFLNLHYDELALHMLVNYFNLPALKSIPDSPTAYVYARFGHSLERIAKALYDNYNPLHNTDVTETEKNSGKDNHEYGGSDNHEILTAHQEGTYAQTENLAITSGSTYDNTAVNDMKPISKTEHQFSTENTSEGNSESTIEYGKTLEMQYGRVIEKSKQGNIGVMPTQNLMQLEFYARFRLTLFDAIVRACVTTLSSGVWEE